MTPPDDARRLALVAKCRHRADSIERHSDGGNKGKQCVSCGEWFTYDGHAESCEVLFMRAIADLLSAFTTEETAKGALDGMVEIEPGVYTTTRPMSIFVPDTGKDERRKG